MTAQPPRFVLPFDGGRPILVCGYHESGKSTFARHLVSALPHQSVVAIRSSNDHSPIPGPNVTTLCPDDANTDVGFYAQATHLVSSIAETHGAVLLIDDYSLLAEPYSTPVPEQQAFVATVEAVVRGARAHGVRPIIVCSRVPEPVAREPFGAQFWMGPFTPVDWVVMYGSEPPAVTRPATVGEGVCGIDGSRTPFAFPNDTAPEPDDTPAVPGNGLFSRLHRRSA